MKTLKTLLLVIIGTAMMAACFDNDGDYNAGIFFERPQQRTTPLYANTVSDSIILFSYGNWDITSEGLQPQWIDIPIKEGKGNRSYAFLVTFMENLTGEGRMASFKIQDTDHPGKAYSSFGYLQYATRGDGALGTAADVKRITGTDGSKIELTYDNLHRPTSVMMTKGESKLHNLSFSYDDQEMTIHAGNDQIRVKCGNSYQPGNLAMENDTMCYIAHRTLYLDLPYSELFSYVHSRHSGDNMAVTYKLHGQSLMPDSLHNADSLTYYVNGEMIEDFAVDYSKMDNRCQSVDVNQLLLGIEHCDPYLLLGLYRYARNTSIISMAKKPNADIEVSTTLNTDKSVATLTVSRHGEEIIYTFEY